MAASPFLGRLQRVGIGEPIETHLFSFLANDLIVIEQQHYVCALTEPRTMRLERGLDQPLRMRKVRVNWLNTETSWSTHVAILGRKRVIEHSKAFNSKLIARHTIG